MTYSPKPGTVAFRAMTHMESLPHGTEISTGALCDALNVPSNNLMPCLLALLKHRRIFKRQKDHSHPRSPFFWSLVDHSKFTSMPASGDVIARVPSKSTETPPALDSQQVLKAEAARPDATDRDAPVTTSPVGGPTGAGQAAAAAPAAAIRIALWSDGVLQVQHATGFTTTFTADETRQLVEFLDRVLIDRSPA